MSKAERALELRHQFGQTSIFDVPFEFCGERTNVRVIMDCGRPLIDLSNAVLAKLIAEKNLNLFSALEDLRVMALEFELQELEAKVNLFRLTTREVERPKQTGYVYLLRSEAGHFKIGRTKHLKSRFANFGIVLPFPVEVLHTICSRDYVKAEAYIHAKFAAKRTRGEWFDLSPEDVEWICAQTNGQLDGE